MNRRTLLKSLFVAPLVPVVALGKGKPKAKFPRWFGLHRLVEYGVWPEYNTQAILWEAKAEDHAIVYWPGGRCGHMRDHYRGTKMPSSTLAALEHEASHGFIVEIPAVAAEAMLKSTYRRSMRPRKPLADTCPACGKRGLFSPCRGLRHWLSPPVSCTECGTTFSVESPTEWSR